MIPLPVREYENHYWKETRPHWIASGVMGVKGGKRRAEAVIVSSWGQAGSPIKNGTRMFSLQVWMWKSQEHLPLPAALGGFVGSGIQNSSQVLPEKQAGCFQKIGLLVSLEAADPQLPTWCVYFEREKDYRDVQSWMKGSETYTIKQFQTPCLWAQIFSS